MGGPVVIIPTWDGWEVLQACLEALEAQQVPDVLVVDNGSRDGTSDAVARRFPAMRILRLDTNVGFASGVNAGIAAVPDRDVVLLNNDAVPRAGWYDELMRAVADAPPPVGFITSKMVRPDGRIDSTGDFQTWSGIPTQRGHGEVDRGQYDEQLEVFSGCGGATWFRRAMLDDVGVLADQFFAYLEDVDLCARAQLRGWSGRLAPSAVVQHAPNTTSGRIHGFKRYQSVRNSWWLVTRTVPRDVLPRVLVRFVFLHVLLLVQAMRHRELLAAVRGHLAGLRGVPRARAERAEIQRGRTIDAPAFASSFRPALPPALLKREARKLLGLQAEADGSKPPYNPDAALRYEAVLALVPDSASSVLEVGSGSGGVAAYADFEVLVGCDRDFDATVEFRAGALVRVAGSAGELPFASGTFDATLCVDALEHFPLDVRGRALREMIRVTRAGGRVVVAAPMGAWAERADRWTNAHFRRKHGREHPWLAEHLENGLPTLDAVLASLEGRPDVVVRVHRNAWLPLWLLLHRVLNGRRRHVILPRVVVAVARRVNLAPSYRRIVEIRT